MAKKDGMFYMGNDNLPNKNWQGEYTPAKIKSKKRQRKTFYILLNNSSILSTLTLVRKRSNYIQHKRQR